MNRGDQLVSFGDSGDQRTGADSLVSNFTASCDLRLNFSDSENLFSDLPSGEMISQFTVAFAALVCELSRLTSTLISGLPCGMLFLKSALHKNPIRRDGHRRSLVQPDVAVDARAFVKPAFDFVASTSTAMVFLPP